MKHAQIIRMFAKVFGGDSFSKSLKGDSYTNWFDSNEEILGQIPGSEKSLPEYSSASLHLGCPLSGQRRELTLDTLFWAPNGWPDKRYKSMACSRLGKQLMENRLVADALRNFVSLTGDHECIVSGQKTTLDKPVRRGCQLYGKSLLQVLPFPRTVTGKWIRSTLAGFDSLPNNHFSQSTLFYSSSMSVDELTFALSEEVRVVRARKEGTVERLCRTFSEPDSGPTIYQLVSSLETSNELPVQSMERATSKPGPVAWYLASRSLKDSAKNKPGANTVHDAPILDLGDFSRTRKGPYLSHWTRADRHHWPDQNELTQFDSMYMGDIHALDKPGTPLETLCRILSQQKILGSGRFVAGKHRVVCFTEVPLADFAKHRVFRPHLSRWDFEPWGISIRQSALDWISPIAVEYVDQSDQCQPATNSVAAGTSAAAMQNSHWTHEREWRISGDIDLRCFGPQEAVVFVPDHESAQIAATLSRWPVVVMQSRNKAPLQ